MYQVRVTMETVKGPGSWRGSVRWSRGWTRGRGPCVVSAPIPRGTLGGYEPSGLVDPTEHAAVRAGTRGSASGSVQGSGPRRLPGIRAASSGPWSGREGRHTTSFGPLYWLRWHPKSWLEAARGGAWRPKAVKCASTCCCGPHGSQPGPPPRAPPRKTTQRQQDNGNNFRSGRPRRCRGCCIVA